MMSERVMDRQGRWRNKTVAFRVSPEEDEVLERAVKLSGLTKQDYIIRRLQKWDIVVQGNPKVYKALNDEMKKILMELQRIQDVSEVTPDPDGSNRSCCRNDEWYERRFGLVKSWQKRKPGQRQLLGLEITGKSFVI